VDIRKVLRRPSVRIGIGLLIGQGFVFAITPLLTRLYSPDQVGIATLILSVAGVAAVAATCRVELVIPSAGAEMVRTLVMIGVTTAVCVSIGVGVSGWFLARLKPLDAALLAAITLGMSATSLTLQLGARARLLQGVAVAKASQGLVQGTTQLAFGAVHWSNAGMSTGYALGYLAAACVQYRVLRTATAQIRRSKRTRISRTMILRLSALTLAGLVNASAVSALPILTQVLFGSSATGELAIAQRIAIVPASLLVATLLPIIAAEAGELVRRRKDTRQFINRWLLRLAPFGAAAALILALIPASWISGLLGDDWGGSAAYMRALAASIALQVAVGPLGQLLALQGRAVAQLVWDVARLCTLIAACLVSARASADPVTMVLVGSVTLALFYGLYAAVLYRRKTDDALK
jgi:O-antigen/teichoic acid export membrane protein